MSRHHQTSTPLTMVSKSIRNSFRSMQVFSSKHVSLPATDSMEAFLLDFDAYHALCQELETPKNLQLDPHLLNIGKQVQQGIRSWTKSDLKDIVRWKRCPGVMLQIENTPDIDERLKHAFKIKDEENRLKALCRIPGVGRVVASAMLTFTSPEFYGILDRHAWNGLNILGFNLPRKDGDGMNFTFLQLLMFLRIVRKLAAHKGTTPAEVCKALYALDKVRENKKWKAQLDIIKK